MDLYKRAQKEVARLAAKNGPAIETCRAELERLVRSHGVQAVFLAISQEMDAANEKFGNHDPELHEHLYNGAIAVTKVAQLAGK